MKIVPKPDDPRRHPRGPRRKKATAGSRPRLALLKRASEELGVPYTSLRTCAADGQFAIVKIGRLQYVEWTELDRWIEAQKERAS
jgi:hypothetical protein